MARHRKTPGQKWRDKDDHYLLGLLRLAQMRLSTDIFEDSAQFLGPLCKSFIRISVQKEKICNNNERGIS
jgi:hypothetical protein